MNRRLVGPMPLALLFMLLAGIAPPAFAAPAAKPAPAPPVTQSQQSCEALQTRISGLERTIKKLVNKTIAARYATERQRLLAEYNSRCGDDGGLDVSSILRGPKRTDRTPPSGGERVEDTPEEESERRREVINRTGTLIGGRLPPNWTARALPLTGRLVLDSSTATSMYGTIKQELSTKIEETFVGNLILATPAARRGGGSQEEYAIQTFSMEINVDAFKGRVCDKFAGNPPSCAKWQTIDLWQVAEGEEYPGPADSVITALSSGNSVTIRVNSPDIEFGSSQGTASIRNKCGNQLNISVNREEFKQWLHRSSMQMTRTVGLAAPGCQQGATLFLEMHFAKEP